MPEEKSESEILRRQLTRIGIAVVGIVLTQASAVIWWGSTISFAIQSHESRIALIESDRYRVEDSRRDLALRDQRVDALSLTISRLEGVLVALSQNVSSLAISTARLEARLTKLKDDE